jgi:hypothetical protein
MYTMNIGLANPFTGGYNTVEQTLSKALQFVSGVQQVRISTDGDEPTVIIHYAYHTGNVAVLATALDQDCIAVYDFHIMAGSLIGDKADQWGAFNPEYFQFITAREYA